MGSICKSMESVCASMDPMEISKLMDKFEKQFDDLDVSSQFMENSIAQSTANTMPENQVDTLMMQVADEHGLEFEGSLDSVGVGTKSLHEAKVKAKNTAEVDEQAELEERLKRLQGL